MMKRLLICFFILFFIFSGPGSAQDFEKLEEIENRLSTAKDDKTKSTLYLELVNEYKYYDSAKSNHYLAKLFALANKNKDTTGLIDYYYLLSLQPYLDHDYAKGLEISRISSKFADGRDTFTFLESIQIQLKALYFLNRSKEAEQLGKAVLRNRDFSSHPIQLAKVYFNLGVASMSLFNDSSVDFFYKAIPLLLDKPNNRVLLPVYHSISNYYRSRNQLDSALKYASLGIELARDTSLYNAVDFILPAYNLQQLLERVGRYEEAKEISRELLMKNYIAKINSISYPEISLRIGYLEYMRGKQKIRFIVLLSISICVFLLFSFAVFYTIKLRKKELQLSESLRLNQILYKETNHRVKNNYQLMLSMLNSTSNAFVQPGDQFMEQTRARIASMAKVHDLFLQNTQVETIHADTFFQEVVQSLANSLNLEQKKITINFQNSPYVLQTKIIITLGLIINELVVNAVKYAFVNRDSGLIVFSLEKVNTDYMMVYKDNGVGFNPSISNMGGSGMAIVFSLAKQLRGEARIKEDQGTIVEVYFKA